MTGITVPFIPAALWLMAASLTIIILLIMFGFYAYWRRRATAILQDSKDFADLSARKNQYEADIEELRRWINDHKNELVQIEAERNKQEHLRQELTDLEQRCLSKEMENETLRKEVGTLENQKYLLAQTLTDLEKKAENLHRIISEQEAKQLEAEKLVQQIEELKSDVNSYHKILENVAVSEIRLQILEREKIELESKVDRLKMEANEAQEAQTKEINKLKSLANESDVEQKNVAELRKERAQLDILVSSLRSEQNALDNQIADLESKLKLLEEDINDLKLIVKEESKEAKKITDASTKAKNVLHEMLNKKEEAEQNVQKSSIRGQMMAKDAESLAKQIKVHEEDLNELKAIVKDENSELIKLRINLENEQKKLKELVNEREDASSKIQTLLARKDTLVNEINALQGHNAPEGKDALKAYADLLEKSPSCLIKDKFENERADANEFAVLEEFKMLLKQQNIHFASRVVDAFHTSLKCQNINPLTVLAGVSGTGKTLLPMMYSEIIGLHCLVMPVQPRWDSPQDLFGFYNYLEKEYKATDLSRALIRFDPFNYQTQDFSGLNSSWVKDRMLIVLLDEMNLARTEYYFSEFLSKLELRRQVDAPKIKTNREKAEIELDTGPGKQVSFRLWVPENILFVGTMNEDETTQTLSDKVLDRANVLRFGKPDDHSQDNGTTQKKVLKQDSFLSRKQWNSWSKKRQAVNHGEKILINGQWN